MRIIFLTCSLLTLLHFQSTAQSKAIQIDMPISVPIFNYKEVGISYNMENRCGNWGQIRIQPFNFNRNQNVQLESLGTFERSSYQFNIAYQYNHIFFKDSDFQLFAGGNTALNLYRNKLTPEASSNFPRTFNRNSLQLGAPLGFRWNMTDHFYFQAQYLLPVLEIGQTKQVIDDPSLTSSEQTNSLIFFEMQALDHLKYDGLDGFSLAVGIRLGKK